MKGLPHRSHVFLDVLLKGDIQDEQVDPVLEDYGLQVGRIGWSSDAGGEDGGVDGGDGGTWGRRLTRGPGKKIQS